MAHKGTHFIRVSVHSQPKPYRPRENRKVYTKGWKEKLLMNRTFYSGTPSFRNEGETQAFPDTETLRDHHHQACLTRMAERHLPG